MVYGVHIVGTRGQPFDFVLGFVSLETHSVRVALSRFSARDKFLEFHSDAKTFDRVTFARLNHRSPSRRATSVSLRDSFKAH